MWIDEAEKLIARTGGQTGLLVKNLKTNDVLFSHNPELVFPSCSVIKAPILLTLMSEVAAGRLDLGEAVPVSPEDLVEGGLVRHMSRDLAMPWRDHALFMIALSDNASANHIISRLGFDAINNEIRKLGMTVTVLRRKMMDFDARARGIDNYTNCRDMLTLFEHLHNSAESYVDVLDILKQQKMKNLLSGLINPDTFEFAHKTGSLPHTLLDTGIMYLKDPVFVAFMTKELKQEQDGYRLAHEIGLLIYEAYA